MLAHTPTLRLLLRKVNCMFIYLRTCPAAFFVLSSYICYYFVQKFQIFSESMFACFIYLFIFYLLAGHEEGKSTNIE